ncbi:aminotransferase class I/II-fold pyridoxal phosphate-dependent enzyme [Paenibacillus sp. FSL R5-0887]|jgi:aminotransferase|uniref:aminotransferase class I/II-fold pyridoxal phosphate-dependent enzyme n=1 Tax=Paenibacillus TaxID=44249 RepID=UPI00096C8D8E|nr:aminotransferase class I/II-fold pyridoxal phosphate-dependent enzyme [Paenibacillus odorifer]OMC66696.1 aromatic amino acid aminotransferase [Paenibacillus odorifer]OMD27800.1 aromatic amino acid aminotransferase [Paenibacillus odorifer]OMD76430.1 aromatic amino acid aminotransferase [Paenibacillus odorifer]OMD92658.1 aromatic amino acid aminotransferase [Paenibacillus odorifer]OMD98484.1 aromatic amino acid aminotransferase [Paenibacillus odorifer]
MHNEWIAPRVREIAPSGIRAFFDLSAGNQDIISLGVGEPDFVTPEHVRAACIRALNNGETMYTPNSGLLELREEIASYLHTSFKLRYEPNDEIMVTVGSSEAVDLALRAFITPGDEIIVPSPSYIAYSPITHLNGGVTVEVESSAEQGFKLTAEALRKVITPRSKLLMVNFPTNPTGAVMTYEDWLPIAQIVKENNLLVISDEIYAELTYDSQHVSIASLPGMLERTIVISGFSKAFAMTGWRVGYACGDRELIAAMLKIHQYTAMCAPVLGQIAAIESLRNGMQHKEHMKQCFDERRKLLVSGFRSIGLPCHEPAGAFYAFPSIAHTGMKSEDFALQLLREVGVAAVPGHVFGAGGEGYIRCSYAASLQKLTEALERIEDFMKVKL